MKEFIEKSELLKCFKILFTNTDEDEMIEYQVPTKHTNSSR